jgi:hypothetical protein
MKRLLTLCWALLLSAGAFGATTNVLVSGLTNVNRSALGTNTTLAVNTNVSGSLTTGRTVKTSLGEVLGAMSGFPGWPSPTVAQLNTASNAIKNDLTNAIHRAEGYGALFYFDARDYTNYIGTNNLTARTGQQIIIQNQPFGYNTNFFVTNSFQIHDGKAFVAPGDVAYLHVSNRTPAVTYEMKFSWTNYGSGTYSQGGNFTISDTDLNTGSPGRLIHFFWYNTYFDLSIGTSVGTLKALTNAVGQTSHVDFDPSYPERPPLADDGTVHSVRLRIVGNTVTVDYGGQSFTYIDPTGLLEDFNGRFFWFETGNANGTGTTSVRRQFYIHSMAVYGDGAPSVGFNPQHFGVGNSNVVSLKVTNEFSTIASNATTAQIDFSTQPFVEHTYELTNMAANVTLQLTNLVRGRGAWFYIRTDGSPRTVTVSTNGITSGTRISWGLASVTNGATAVTVTNRLRLHLTVQPVGEVAAAYEHQQ